MCVCVMCVCVCVMCVCVCVCDVCVWLSLFDALGVNYVQKVVTVPVTGGVFITCKFAHTSHRVGCIVILTSGSFRKGGSAIASNEGVTIPQATVEFNNLRPHEYTYSATAYLVANRQLL